VDMDIHKYIHVRISDLSHPVDISMDIMVPNLLIKLNTYIPVCRYYSSFSRLFIQLIQINRPNQ